MMNRPYYDGHQNALSAVNRMNITELYFHIDGLYGRDRLSANPSLDELRSEAIRQTNLDWLDPAGDNYQMLYRLLTD